jgi:ribosomal protein L40E
MEPKEPKPKLQATDLLTQQEKEKLKAATSSLRDKALIACFDEAGFRPGELLKVKIKNVRKNPTYAEIDVNGKTGPRVVHIIKAYSDLAQWLDVHPQKNNPEAYLWSDSSNGAPFKYDQARNRLLNIAKKANIRGKRIYLYLLRHGSITENAKALPDQLLKKRFGWTKGSRSIEVYDHLTSTDLKDALLQQAGLVGEKSKEQPIVTLCPRCNAPNPASSSVCFKCKSALSVEKAMKFEELEKKISRLEELEKKVGELNIMAKEADKFRIRFQHRYRLIPTGQELELTDEEVDEILEAEKKATRRLEEAGLVLKD